nr:hypothetical protein [Tanacetum cinerariifolium]
MGLSHYYSRWNLAVATPLLFSDQLLYPYQPMLFEEGHNRVNNIIVTDSVLSSFDSSLSVSESAMSSEVPRYLFQKGRVDDTTGGDDDGVGVHYNINSIPQRQFGAFPSDLSLGKRRWGTLVRDSFPNDNLWRKGGSYIFSCQKLIATVAYFIRRHVAGKTSNLN